MDNQSWGINVETDTDEPCPHCGDYLKIIEDAVYYVDDDGTQPGYCAACPGCGNAWPWQRTPEQALDAVDRVVVLEQQLAALTAENAALRAQLAAAQEWQPVSDGEYGTIHVEENGEWIAINDRDSDGLKSYLGTTPPDDLRLCRRTRQEPPA